MVASALREFGRLDLLVLDAGLPAPGAIETLPMERFDRVRGVNLRGVVLGVRASIFALKASDAAAIVMTASVSGLAGDPGMWVYNAAKAGVVNFARAAALDLAREGIRVNCVCPGPVRTGMTAIIEQAAPEAYEALLRNVPLQRWGEPIEVARVIAFLGSSAASFVTGAAVPVDGGVLANTGQFAPPALRAAEGDE